MLWFTLTSVGTDSGSIFSTFCPQVSNRITDSPSKFPQGAFRHLNHHLTLWIVMVFFNKLTEQDSGFFSLSRPGPSTVEMRLKNWQNMFHFRVGPAMQRMNFSHLQKLKLVHMWDETIFSHTQTRARPREWRHTTQTLVSHSAQQKWNRIKIAAMATQTVWIGLINLESFSCLPKFPNGGHKPQMLALMAFDFHVRIQTNSAKTRPALRLFHPDVLSRSIRPGCLD